MQLHGQNIIGFSASNQGNTSYKGVNPTTKQELTTTFKDASEAELAKAAQLAAEAFETYRHTAPEQKAGFLEQIADALEAKRALIVTQADAETALGETRLNSELSRTTGQLRMFAELIREGSWVDARIEHADPERQPQPKPDLRRMLAPLGPVAVFGASNFPLAFSVAGGDTASALAAGCPVVFKVHPAHPGTSELAGRVVSEVAQEAGLPDGTFSLLHGRSHEVGVALVRHDAIRAAGFTGSLTGGRALFDAAAQRPVPIPVYAEMGSVNPVFLLPGAFEHTQEVAAGLAKSVTLGVGQFCTNPGLVVALASPQLETFVRELASQIEATQPGVMLYENLSKVFEEETEQWQKSAHVEVVGSSASQDPGVRSLVFETSGHTFLEQPSLHEEIFGPSTLVVKAADRAEFLEVARALGGQLTATLHAQTDELEGYSDLINVLQDRVGRLIFNGFPTGVEVGHAMHHGGPYPATTDARSTSVGSAAIYRFARPICYQDFPQAALPPELRDANPRGILRLVDGVYAKEQPCI